MDLHGAEDPWRAVSSIPRTPGLPPQFRGDLDRFGPLLQIRGVSARGKGNGFWIGEVHHGAVHVLM